jgi:hypothetical protein
LVEKTKPRWVRRILLALLAIVLAIGAVPAYYFVRLRFLEPHYHVTSIRTLATYQDRALLERAWALPTARTFHHRVVWQSNGSTCGPTSAANVLRSFGERATERSVVDGTGLCWTGMCMGGLTIDQLARVIRHASHHRVTVLRDLTIDQLRTHLRRSNDPTVRYIVNFHRGPLFSDGGGHFSPVAGYLEDRDLAFILDVNESYRPWLVPVDRLFAAIDTIDSDGGKKRGLLLLR